MLCESEQSAATYFDMAQKLETAEALDEIDVEYVGFV